MEELKGPIVPVDIVCLRKLKKEMDEINTTKKSLQSKINDICNKAVPILLQMGIRYIAANEAGPNTGPYFTLTKNTVEGSWTKDRQVIFWRAFLQHQKNKPEEVDTPQKCSALMNAFLIQFQKRTIVLKEVNQVHERDGTDRLQHWAATGEDIG